MSKCDGCERAERVEVDGSIARVVVLPRELLIPEGRVIREL